MTMRGKYVLWYILSLIVPAIIAIIGTLAIFSYSGGNKALSLPSLYLLCFTLSYVGSFIINYWYASKLNKPTGVKILAAIFHSFGFFYLMGHSDTVIRASTIIKTSWNLYVKNWKAILPYLGWLFLVTLVISFTGLIPTLLHSSSGVVVAMDGLLILILVAAGIVFSIWLSISLAQVMAKLLQGDTLPKTKELMFSNKHLIWPAFYTSILVFLIVLGGTFLFIIPGIIFSIWYTFSYYAIALDEKKGLAALRTSKSLVVGRWFVVLWRMTAPAVVFALIAMALNLVLSILISFLHLPIGVSSQISTILSLIVNTLITPLTVSATALLYLNLKKQQAIAPVESPKI